MRGELEVHMIIHQCVCMCVGRPTTGRKPERMDLTYLCRLLKSRERKLTGVELQWQQCSV